LKLHTWTQNIRKGDERIEVAISQRKGEQYQLNSGLDWLRKELERISKKRRSQPYVIIHLSEGATALSVLLEWLPLIQDIVESFGGFLIIVLNIGHKVAEIPVEEYKRREDVIVNFLKEKVRPPVIVTTNCFRIGEEIVDANINFDEHYLTATYMLDRCSIAKPLKEDLSNLLKLGSIHTISVPIKATDFSSFETRVANTSFMFLGKMGASREAPLVEEAEKRIDGILLLGNTKEHLRAIIPSFENRWPGRRIVAYATEYAEKKLKIPFIPAVHSTKPVKTWIRENFFAVFTATLELEEVQQAIKDSREFWREKTGRTA
jgi:hypothetical protein